MLFTGPEIVDQFQTINLHPALPGTAEGTYQQVIWKLIEERSTESGVTIHVATEILDDGAPLSYCTYPIRGPEFDDLWTEIEDVPIRQLISEGEEQPLFRAIRRHGAIREAPLLIETLKSLADGRIRIHNGRVVDEQLVETDGLSLDKEVECALNDCSR
jgi:folate-dependent phosphoribosylglycinamide formyltransferase PurN